MNRDKLRSPTLSNRVWATFFMTLSLTVDREPELRPGVVVPALVIGVVKTRGLQVQLPCHKVGDAHFTDLLDSYTDHPETGYHVGQFVRCCVLSELASVRRKWAVSLRPSRSVTVTFIESVFGVFLFFHRPSCGPPQALCFHPSSCAYMCASVHACSVDAFSEWLVVSF